MPKGKERVSACSTAPAEKRLDQEMALHLSVDASVQRGRESHVSRGGNREEAAAKKKIERGAVDCRETTY